MGDSTCHKFAKGLESRIKLLYQMQSNIMVLYSNPSQARVWYKKLPEPTLEFIGLHPCMTRVNSYDIVKGNGTLYQLKANDLLMEMAYGTKSPNINLQGPSEGLEWLDGFKCHSWIEYWGMKIGSQISPKFDTQLPKNVEPPMLNTRESEGYYVGC